MKPRVSVVIPAYKEEKYIGKTLKSLNRQDFPRDEFEIIVVVTSIADKDKTAEIAKKLGAKVIYERRRGIGLARQKGVLAAKGEIIVGTDADTEFPRNWIKTICEIFDSDENIVGVCGPFGFYDDNRVSTKIFLLFVRLAIQIVNVVFGPPFIGFNHSFRKKQFLEIGGYDPQYRVCFEDLKASIDLRKKGKIVYSPNAYVLTSSRRYRSNFFNYTAIPVIEFFRITIFNKKPLLGEWKSYR